MSENDTTSEADDEIEGSRMTLSEHLNELRARLVRSLVVFALAFSVLYSFQAEVAQFVFQPQMKAVEQLEEKLDRVLAQRVLDGELKEEDFFVPGTVTVDAEGVPDGTRLPTRNLIIVKYDAATGSFLFNLKVCFLVALAIAIPVALWEVWGFIAAGLYKHEKRVAYWFLPPAILLFYGGIVFGYTVMVPVALFFTQGVTLGQETPPIPREVNLNDYLAFLRGLCLALGVVFQIPIVQLMLAKTGVVHPRVFAKYRGHMAVGMLIFAALITPPDPFTQMLLAGPAIVLWEVGYWIARITTKNMPEPLELEPA